MHVRWTPSFSFRKGYIRHDTGEQWLAAYDDFGRAAFKNSVTGEISLEPPRNLEGEGGQGGGEEEKKNEDLIVTLQDDSKVNILNSRIESLDNSTMTGVNSDTSLTIASNLSQPFSHQNDRAGRRNRKPKIGETLGAMQRSTEVILPSFH